MPLWNYMQNEHYFGLFGSIIACGYGPYTPKIPNFIIFVLVWRAGSKNVLQKCLRPAFGHQLLTKFFRPRFSFKDF